MKATLTSEFKYLELFLRPKYGDMFPIDHFMEMVEDGGIIPEDGILDEVIIDNHLTNIVIRNWNPCSKLIDIDFDRPERPKKALHSREICVLELEEVRSLPGDVKVMWYNK